MQKALENPHYKKIWEKVMMNRHPEVKSLEEALINEKQYFDCCFSYNEITSYVGSMCDNLKIDIQAYNGMAEEYVEQLSWQKKAAFLANFETKYTLLGRPITLEDILLLLSNLTNDNKITIQDIDIVVKNTCILPEKKRLDNPHICIEVIKYLEQEDGDEDEEMIYWYFDIVKPLHEQTSQVWENISKLID